MQRRSTKELLGESFRELVRQKPINKITIANITGNCGMTPPTFYNHFRDKYDLMTWLYVSDTKSIMGQIGKDGYQWRDTLLDGIRYSAEHKSELLNAFTHTSGREAFLGYMMRANTDLLSTEVRKKLMTENIPEDILLMIKIYCYGTSAYLCEWIADNTPVSPEELADAMEKSLPEPLKPYLYP
ncbi:MAG: TetR/AcrR family transcriptional regulator C-terminal domain-containing protein [Oscillibacter sp.]|nr:TetR/AcrR family transcriptional regulator C-terminal domain-containing protein [Oscillibacter sp.]